MSFWYVASSQKSTAVTASLICELITNNEKNLVITKGNSLEIYGTTNNNLNLLFSIPLFGNIATVLKYKTSNYSANGGSNSSSNAAGSNVSNQLDSLLIITRKGQYFCLSYDTNTNKFETVAVGPVTKEKEKYTIRAETTVIDPDGRVACIDCEGHLKVVVLN